ncbi:aminoglycoside phosphotransferase [Micromonospora sp. WMMD980]|uniref:phosphotransferase family protein n=1 Tax=Micromonospora sp. WMMD980 TaxID=3016088 RepID=UPI0024180513|nr:aminoglycoside phosphotransferase [Micromonospora sp. WMMD980]MDG4801903.1 aminoglycoside phosphotransferase [Micromonospora sp. WMMD980]
MTRTFLRPDDVRDLVRDRLGTDRRVTTLDRLTGGTSKGVYRITLDDGTTVILYVWSAEENYWPASATVPDDPFTEASGADVFATNHAALTAAGVRVPHLIAREPAGRHLDADVALVEDAGGVTLEALLTRDPERAAEPLARLGDALRRMHTTVGGRYGRLADVARGTTPARPAEDVVLDRALGHLAAAAARDPRPAAARDRIAVHLRGLRDRVSPRRAYALVHGELGPDHVLVTPAGEPVMIDFEGLTWFDVEWEHVWLRLRFGDDYPALRPVPLDADRLEFYRYAQVLSLIEGPLRIAGTDFPDRRWMLDLAERNIAEALAVL